MWITTHNVAVQCVAVVWIAKVGKRSMEVEVLDAVCSTNPRSSHTNGYTHSKVNLSTEELTIETNSMEQSPS